MSEHGWILEHKIRLEREKRRFRQLIRWETGKTVLWIIAAILFSWFLFGQLFAVAIVEGSSMEPSLQNGDLLLVKRHEKDFKKGDIVILKPEENEDKIYVKRIVGEPGDLISMADGKLWINGFPEDRSAITEKTEPRVGAKDSIKLGRDEYFVLGDAREHSEDSRDFGPIHKSQIEGKSMFLLFRATAT